MREGPLKWAMRQALFCGDKGLRWRGKIKHPLDAALGFMFADVLEGGDRQGYLSACGWDVLEGLGPDVDEDITHAVH